MTAKEYLGQAYGIKARLAVMAEQLELLESAAVYVAPALSDTPSAIGKTDRQENAVIRIVEHKQRMLELFGLLGEINEAINSVKNPMAQAVLYKRHIESKSWESISRELFVSRSNAIALHKAAIADVEKFVLNCTVLNEKERISALS